MLSRAPSRLAADLPVQPPSPTPSPTVLYDVLPSPVGDLLLTGDGHALTGVLFTGADGRHEIGVGWRHDSAALAGAVSQLQEYFAGDRREFDLPLASRGTAFQHRVWDALRLIPYGSTWSYGQLARHLGSPGAARAVGLANGQNPVSVVVPCHRVIGSGGSLVGYGGGLPRKTALLELERRHAGLPSVADALF